MSWSTSVPPPTRPVPTGEDWVPVSVTGVWYWDGSAWRRTAVSPWSAVDRRRGWRGRERRAAPVLLAPLLFVVALVEGILSRALTAAMRLVVGVFAFGAVVALVVLLIAALLHT